MQLNKAGWKNLSLIAFDFMVQSNGNSSKEALSHEGTHFTLSHKSILWLQESVIFPLRSQINPFPSKFVKVFSPTATCVTHGFLCFLIAQSRGMNKIHSATWITLKSNQFYIIQ